MQTENEREQRHRHCSMIIYCHCLNVVGLLLIYYITQLQWTAFMFICEKEKKKKSRKVTKKKSQFSPVALIKPHCDRSSRHFFFFFWFVTATQLRGDARLTRAARTRDRKGQNMCQIDVPKNNKKIKKTKWYNRCRSDFLLFLFICADISLRAIRIARGMGELVVCVWRLWHWTQAQTKNRNVWGAFVRMFGCGD